MVILLQPEQANAEGHEICAFTALQRRARSGLQTFFQKLLAGLNLGIGRVTDNRAGRFEPLGGQRLKRLSGGLL